MAEQQRRYNEKTKQYEYSSDGGKTWKTASGSESGSASGSGGSMSGGNAEARSRAAKGIAGLRARSGTQSHSRPSGGSLGSLGRRPAPTPSPTPEEPKPTPTPEAEDEKKKQ